MFTGIVEEIGIVKSFFKDSNGATIKIGCKIVLEDTTVGDSIAVNGCCQTVVSMDSDSFTARVSDETISVTTFRDFKSGDCVNLERALTLNSRLGGHIVSGHIDCCAKFLGKDKLSDFYNLRFELPQTQSKYVVYKGSITVNGISLTVSDICENVFKVAVIPHTFENTNLNMLNIGDYVNIETDILGKYVEKLLSVKDNNNSLSMSFLQENGFI